ncbi:MAG TPA: hypothetical protein VII06_11695 [Chloroflexota bacterium]|jgi:hypothetical protein
MRPHEVAASVEPTQWETILAAVREHNAHLWHDLERAACQDQRIPPRLWQRYSAADRRALVRRALVAPASGPLALDALREYLMAEQLPVITRFLDLASVAHEEGVLAEGPVPEPEAAQLDSAVDTLLAEVPRATALLYLRALSAQENVDWPRLEERLAAEARAPAPADASPPLAAATATPAPPSAPPAAGAAGAPPRPPRAAASEPGPAAQATPEAAPADAPPPDVTGHAVLAPPPTDPLGHGDGPSSSPMLGEARGPSASAPPGPGQSRQGAGAADTSAPPLLGGLEGAVPGAGAAIFSPAGSGGTVPVGAAGAPTPAPTRARPLPSSARKPERPPPTAPLAAPPTLRGAEPAAPEPKPARNGAATPAAPPAPAPPAPWRERRAAPRLPRPALAARLPVPPPDPPGLTALDHLLLRARAASRAEAPGAPDAADLGAAVDEIARLSADRPPSAYHLGLLAADAALAAPPAGSAAHAAWYHAGRLAGWAQQQRWDEVARFYADEPGAAGALLRHDADLGAWAGAWLLTGLLAADVPALAADALRHCAAVATLPARETLLDAADALLRTDRAAETSAVLDVLAALPPLPAPPANAAATPAGSPQYSEVGEASSPQDSEAGDIGSPLYWEAVAAPSSSPSAPRKAQSSPDSPQDWGAGGAAPGAAAAYHARLRRAQAECLQAQGLFGAARARLEAALADAAGAERARLLGALGLVAGEFAQLADLRLPEAELDPAPWLRRLEAGAPCFADALAAAPPAATAAGADAAATATASYCLSAAEWLHERPGAARGHFEAALLAMQAQPAAFEPSGALAQARFYLGACLLLDLDTAARPRALDLLRQAAAAGFRAAPPAWQRLLEPIGLDPSLADPLFALFSQQADAAAPDAPALPPTLVQAFLARCAPRSDLARQRLAALCARDDVPAAERWDLLLRLLRAQRQAADADGASAALDLLEGLALAPAEDSPARLQRWCHFLADSASYEPEWSWEDILWSRVRALELLGRDDDAFWLLDAPFSRQLADATPEALAAAEDLLAHARQLAVSPEARAALPEMAARLRARQEAARQELACDEDCVAAQLRQGRILRVLWVGGNETQARHEKALRAALEQRDEASGGRIVLEFRTPGFNSNWDKTLEAVRGYRGRVDALVLMPFVRTQLGRALRRLASDFAIPWVPCTGKGYDSMERALRVAIVLAARK